MYVPEIRETILHSYYSEVGVSWRRYELAYT